MFNMEVIERFLPFVSAEYKTKEYHLLGLDRYAKSLVKSSVASFLAFFVLLWLIKTYVNLSDYWLFFVLMFFSQLLHVVTPLFYIYCRRRHINPYFSIRALNVSAFFHGISWASPLFFLSDHSDHSDHSVLITTITVFAMATCCLSVVYAAYSRIDFYCFQMPAVFLLTMSFPNTPLQDLVIAGALLFLTTAYLHQHIFSIVSNELISQVELKKATEKLEENLTTIKDKHNALVSTQQQLVQAEKMSGLGILVAGVAHEINNPTHFTYLASQNVKKSVSHLKEFLFQMADDNSDDAMMGELSQYFDGILDQMSLIESGTIRLKNTVDSLQRFSRLDQERYTKVCPDDELALTYGLVYSQYKDKVQFSLNALATNERCYCYPDALHQVFMNLMVNACHAILDKRIPHAANGRLSIETDVVQMDCRLWWQAKFVDNGVGMDQAVINAVFQPFFTTKEVGKGTGLGLSVSYGVIQKHYGHIIVDSALGEGSTFTIRIPFVQSLAEFAELKQ